MRPTLLLSFILPAYCVLVNRIIDDTFSGDDNARITYRGDWSAGSASASSGLAKPDASKAHGGTWHDATQDTNIDKEQAYIEISFQGTAISIYSILGNNLGDGIGTKADYSFFLDSTSETQRFIHNKDSSAVDFYYNRLVFKSSNLSQGRHTLKIVLNGGAGVPGSSLMLFDYASITYDDGTKPPTVSSTSTASSSSTSSTSSNTSTKTSESLSKNSLLATSSSSSTDVGTILPVMSTPSPDHSTQTNSVTPSDSKGDLVSIIGGAVGGFIGLVLIIALFFFFRMRRAQRRNGQAVELLESNVGLMMRSDNASALSFTNTSNTHGWSQSTHTTAALQPLRGMPLVDYSEPSESSHSYAVPIAAASTASSYSVSHTGRESWSEAPSIISGQTNPSWQLRQQMMDEELGPPPQYDGYR